MVFGVPMSYAWPCRLAIHQLTRQDGNATVLSDLLHLGSKKAPRPGPVSLSSAMVLRHPPPKKNTSMFDVVFVFAKAQHVRGFFWQPFEDVFVATWGVPLTWKLVKESHTWQDTECFEWTLKLRVTQCLSHQYDALTKLSLTCVYATQKCQRKSQHPTRSTKICHH